MQSSFGDNRMGPLLGNGGVTVNITVRTENVRRWGLQIWGGGCTRFYLPTIWEQQDRRAPLSNWQWHGGDYNLTTDANPHTHSQTHFGSLHTIWSQSLSDGPRQTAQTSDTRVSVCSLLGIADKKHKSSGCLLGIFGHRSSSHTMPNLSNLLLQQCTAFSIWYLLLILHPFLCTLLDKWSIQSSLFNLTLYPAQEHSTQKSGP